MIRSVLVVAVVAMLGGPGAAQVKKQFSVPGSEPCEVVQLTLKAKAGICYIRPSQNEELLNVYSNQDVEEYGHFFSKDISHRICRVKLFLDANGSRGLGQQISSQVFGSENLAPDKHWKVYLSDTKPYHLEFIHGFGAAHIDLSGLAIEKLKINSGSADMRVAFNSGAANRMPMDTFFVKVDVGTVDVKQVNLARSKVVVADVGFGNMKLDFSDRPTGTRRVFGSVGAGNLTIVLPPDDVPVMVKVKDSWLCSVNLAKSLSNTGKNTFANAAYTKNQKDALVFDLEVSLGKIEFR
jgi:hypothetical protein